VNDRVAQLATLAAPPVLAGGLGLTDPSLRLRRAWPRGGDHLGLEYVTADGRRVAGQWFGVDGDPDQRRLQKVAKATARAARHRDHVAVLPDRGILLQAAGADRRLPALALLAARGDTTLVVHRPERRAVVRLSGGAHFAKVVRPERVDGLLRGGRVVPAAARIATPRVDLVDASCGLVVSDAVAGTALHDRFGDVDAPAAWRAAGAALRRLHDSLATLDPAGLPRHDAAVEAAVVTNWLERVSRFRPAVAAALRTAAQDALARLAEPAAGAALLHRDWHDKNVLVDDAERVGMIDLDTLALGEPALDLANALVHLELRAQQGRCTATTAEACAAGLLDGYAPAPAMRARLHAYVVATRVRLVCVYAFRPGAELDPATAFDRPGAVAPLPAALSAEL